MLGLARAERKTSRFVRDNVNLDELYDQISTLRDYVTELTGRGANRQFGRARNFAAEAAQEAEEAMKDNLAASLILAVGIGVVVGYFLRRGTE